METGKIIIITFRKLHINSETLFYYSLMQCCQNKNKTICSLYIYFQFANNSDSTISNYHSSQQKVLLGAWQQNFFAEQKLLFVNAQFPMKASYIGFPPKMVYELRMVVRDQGFLAKNFSIYLRQYKFINKRLSVFCNILQSD